METKLRETDKNRRMEMELRETDKKKIKRRNWNKGKWTKMLTNGNEFKRNRKTDVFEDAKRRRAERGRRGAGGAGGVGPAGGPFLRL